MKIKICGLMNEHDVKICEKMGIHMLGFVVEYPKNVPWNLTKMQAKKLISATKRQTCIVTGGEPTKIISLAKELKPDFVQLHYKETVSQVAKIATELKKLKIKTIKAVCEEKNIKELCETEICAILVDSRTYENAREKGKAFDVDLFRKIKDSSTKPLILAGGINPDNVHEIILKTEADWIDVMTGVEHTPGVKDRKKIERLISEGYR